MSGLTRRRFLGLGMGVGALAVSTTATGCGGGAGGGATPDSTEQTVPALTGDAAVAGLLAGLENLVIGAYDTLLAAASAGTLGTVPAIVAAVVATAKAQHAEHLAVWNGVLRTAGKPEVTTPDAGLKPTIDGMLALVKDVEGTARIALLMEEILADTYLKAIPTLADGESVRVAALILATDQQHQVVLRFALGEQPVPEPLQIPDKAAS